MPLSRAWGSLTWQTHPVAIGRWARAFAGGTLSAGMAKLNARHPWSHNDQTYDLVTMVAVLHHLDVPKAVHEVRRRLSPGGRFLAVGLAQPRTVRYHVWDVASMITNPIIGYVKHPWPSRADGAQPPSFPVRDPFLSFDELGQLLDKDMPGAVIRHRLGFRHTIAWTKQKP